METVSVDPKAVWTAGTLAHKKAAMWAALWANYWAETSADWKAACSVRRKVGLKADLKAEQWEPQRAGLLVRRKADC